MAEVHETAQVSRYAELASDVIIGPYSVIEGNARIDQGTVIHGHVFIGENTHIGKSNQVYQGAIVGSLTQDLKYDGGQTFLEVGDRNVIREYVTVNRGTADGTKTIVGHDNNFLAYTHIAHDCIVGDHVIMSNLSTLAGHVVVEDAAVIAGYVGIHQFCKIGTMAMVGGMSKVTKDVPPYMKVQGIPARVFGMNSVGLERNGVDKTERRVLRQAYNFLYRSGYNVSQAIEEIRSDLEETAALRRLLEFLEKSDRGIVRG
ncbi:acyl-ACP--UDP-N-acetylglucosamine O-acyltransferase [bacterium]|jgi:UDP-N-acetylglucosamine acyltransferase|nr:acyl-ACP--UDP-N-acetylglucosamine O-acyltransferase [bacterium]